MAKVTQDIMRTYESGPSDQFNDLPVLASENIYEGVAVGDNASGYMRQLIASDPFRGFCARKAENASGVNGAMNVKVKECGKIILEVNEVSGVSDVGLIVYASGSNTFTLTEEGNTPIGKIVRYISGTKVVVAFEAKQLRSL